MTDRTIELIVGFSGIALILAVAIYCWVDLYRLRKINQQQSIKTKKLLEFADKATEHSKKATEIFNKAIKDIGNPDLIKEFYKEAVLTDYFIEEYEKELR